MLTSLLSPHFERPPSCSNTGYHAILTPHLFLYRSPRLDCEYLLYYNIEFAYFYLLYLISTYFKQLFYKTFLPLVSQNFCIYSMTTYFYLRITTFLTISQHISSYSITKYFYLMYLNMFLPTVS